ncbi:MAG: UvrB/UvrC motif-containing protein [Candidatus Omnitrophota bacterium]|nr:MAG: UvrB/UvrC motif-containing protein [Candidatus Omnitrophota bacterium]
MQEEERLEERLELHAKDIELKDIIAQLEKEMFIAAKNLQFEKAAQIRDKVIELKKVLKEKK